MKILLSEMLSYLDWKIINYNVSIDGGYEEISKYNTCAIFQIDWKQFEITNNSNSSSQECLMIIVKLEFWNWSLRKTGISRSFALDQLQRISAYINEWKSNNYGVKIHIIKYFLIIFAVSNIYCNYLDLEYNYSYTIYIVGDYLWTPRIYNNPVFHQSFS